MNLKKMSVRKKRSFKKRYPAPLPPNVHSLRSSEDLNEQMNQYNSTHDKRYYLNTESDSGIDSVANFKASAKTFQEIPNNGIPETFIDFTNTNGPDIFNIPLPPCDYESFSKANNANNGDKLPPKLTSRDDIQKFESYLNSQSVRPSHILSQSLTKQSPEDPGNSHRTDNQPQPVTNKRTHCSGTGSPIPAPITYTDAELAEAVGGWSLCSDSNNDPDADVVSIGSNSHSSCSVILGCSDFGASAVASPKTNSVNGIGCKTCNHSSRESGAFVSDSINSTQLQSRVNGVNGAKHTSTEPGNGTRLAHLNLNGLDHVETESQFLPNSIQVTPELPISESGLKQQASADFNGSASKNQIAPVNQTKNCDKPTSTTCSVVINGGLNHLATPENAEALQLNGHRTSVQSTTGSPPQPVIQPRLPKVHRALTNTDLEKKELVERGTVRRFREQRKNGEGTFLMHNETNQFASEIGKLVIYVTSCGIIRNTYARCVRARKILETHLVPYEIRDLAVDRNWRTELKERLPPNSACTLPQVFYDASYLADLERLEELNETGDLRRVFAQIKLSAAPSLCQVCGGYRYIVCKNCLGSKKTKKQHAGGRGLRCTNCDRDGLVRCPQCIV